jgi:hypothetical protein
MWESRVLCEISKSLWKPFLGFHGDVISTSRLVRSRSRRRDENSGDAGPLSARRSSFLAPPTRSFSIGRSVRSFTRGFSAASTPPLRRAPSFERRRTDLAECRMAAALVIEHVDVVEQLHLGFAAAVESVSHFTLHAREEALHHRIVVAVAAPAHHCSETRPNGWTRCWEAAEMPERLLASVDLSRMLYSVVAMENERQLLRPVIYSTAFCVGPGIFVTAGHVLSMIADEGGRWRCHTLTTNAACAPLWQSRQR